MTELEYKKNFIAKHADSDWKVSTSPMDQYDGYTKVYLFEDGAQMHEVISVAYETVHIEYEVRGIKFAEDKEVKLLRTEMWNSDDSRSVFFYEKY